MSPPAARLVLIAAATATLLTACAPAAPTPTPTPTQSATATTAAPVECTREELTTTYEATDNTPGQTHGILTFTNSSDAACSIDGYPTAYVEDPIKTQPLGAVSEDDTAATPTPVLLQPGEQAQAALTITRGDLIEGCDVVTAFSLLVAPPLSHPVTTQDLQTVETPEFFACDNDDISLVRAGSVGAG
jgi:uncharacterized protein DUF4232